MLNYIKKHNILEILGYITILLIIFLVHYVNLFQYPYYENDEGAYVSQAWSIIKFNSLAPYTYWYDHAPFGWFLIAFFSKILGGFYTLGTAINTGRAMMMFLHIVSSFFVIQIVKKSTKSTLAGFVAALAFSVLPLANYFQRRVLLDNILMFWFLPAFYLLLDTKLKIRNLIVSAVLFAIAILSKESGVFFIPGVLYLILTGLHKTQRIVGLIIWTGFFASVIAIYPMLAILKTELLPSTDKVSLLETLSFQATRGDNKAFWIAGSDFMRAYESWITRDMGSVYLLIVLISLSFLLTIFFWRNRIWTGTFLLLVCYLYYLLRGKIVLELYIIPLFPVVGILTGFMVARIFSFSDMIQKYLKSLFFVVISSLLLFLQIVINPVAFFKNETIQYNSAVTWIRNNLPADTKIVVDGGVLLELRDSKDGKEKVYQNADWYWKTDLDPDVRTKKLNDNPENIDYILATFQYYNDISSGALPFNQKALNESKQVIDFSEGGITSTIFQVVQNKELILKNTWQKYKETFLIDGNRVIDPQSKNTTSEGQSYALLRALWSDDMTTFDNVWRWTKTNLQIREKDKLLAWRKLENGTVELENATDGDIDVSLALLLASKKLKNINPTISQLYQNEGTLIIQDIWKNRVVRLGDKLAVLPFTSTKEKGYEIINASYFSPAHYRVFAEFDKANQWSNLAFDSYQILNELHKNHVLIPNWSKFNYSTGQYEDATETMNTPTANEFGYDAMRVYFRVLMDDKWFARGEAKEFLGTAVGFFEKEYKNNGLIKSSYNSKGEAIENYESTAMDSAAYAVLEGSKSKLSGQFWRQKFIERVDLKNQLFDQNNNYYNQNWGWFAFANNIGMVKKDFVE
jgi:endo-1,4-beta-D-glucanase Y/4-amino-4-deoxy-L-arabinose transferase-like glycosyltransferase